MAFRGPSLLSPHEARNAGSACGRSGHFNHSRFSEFGYQFMIRLICGFRDNFTEQARWPCHHYTSAKFC
jgi:hypothetical protein